MSKSSHSAEFSSGLGNVASYEVGVVQASAFRVVKRLTEISLSPYHLTMMQWFAIGTIYNTKQIGISTGELRTVLGTNLPYVTNLINDLEARNIVSRTVAEHDTRVRLLRIHPDFVGTVQTIEAHVRQSLRGSIYSSVTPAELRTYVTVLYKFNALA